MRSPPSTKASAMATGGITKAATVGIGTDFERIQLPLSFSVWENNLPYFSASNMMAIKNNMKSANARDNGLEGERPSHAVPTAMLFGFSTLGV